MKFSPIVVAIGEVFMIGKASSVHTYGATIFAGGITTRFFFIFFFGHVDYYKIKSCIILQTEAHSLLFPTLGCTDTVVVCFWNVGLLDGYIFNTGPLTKKSQGLEYTKKRQKFMYRLV